MTETQDLDFRDFLQAEFIQRCRKNTRYSLRAYAKSLQIDHSTLSQILRGKRNLTRKTILKLSECLEITEEQLNSFLQSFEKNGGKLNEYQSLSLDMYAVIGDWYHFAIFELITVSHFKQDFKWIASKLGLKESEAQQAVERMMRVGLIRTDENGRWVQSSANLTTVNNEFTAEAFRNAQKTKLAMAAKALEEVPFEKRDNSAIMMAINTKKIPEAKRRIKEFRRELCDWLQKDASRDAVYEMVSAFYPITQSEEL